MQAIAIANRNAAGKNYIINGNFDIWQRGTTQSATGYGSADRWYVAGGGSTKVFNQQAFTLGQGIVPNEPRYFARMAVTSVAGASNSVYLMYRIESVRSLAGKTVTLSFWAKADAAKNIAVEFGQIFGTGGSPSVAVWSIAVTTVSLTTNLAKYMVTATLPSISGKTLGSNNDDYLAIVLWFDAGSNYNAETNSLGQQSGTFDIAQVQLEEGPVATDFEYRPIGYELALCQRYFETGYYSDWKGSGLSTPSIYQGISFNTTKRAAPTLVLQSPQYTNAAGTGGLTATPAAGGQDVHRFSFNMAGMTNGSGISSGWTADAEL